MNAKQSCALAVVLIMLATPSLATAQPYAVGTAFTYQGRLTQGGVPVTTVVNLEFTLWSDPVSVLPADQIGGVQAIGLTPDANGLFTVVLNGAAEFTANPFDGQACWLEITVDGSTLSPRQEVTPAPYALALPGLWTEQNATSPNLIGGHSDNSATAGVVGAAIAGGGFAGQGNTASANYTVVGGGIANTASGSRATVGGGHDNTASGTLSTAPGGYLNQAGGGSALPPDGGPRSVTPPPVATAMATRVPSPGPTPRPPISPPPVPTSS